MGSGFGRRFAACYVEVPDKGLEDSAVYSGIIAAFVDSSIRARDIGSGAGIESVSAGLSVCARGYAIW